MAALDPLDALTGAAFDFASAFLGTATLVSPSIAILPADIFPWSGVSAVRFGTENRPIRVMRTEFDEDRRIVMLILAVIIHTNIIDAREIDDRGPCRTSWYDPDARRLVARGKVVELPDHRFAAAFDDISVEPGGPVISDDGALIGVLGRGGRGLHVIPIKAIRASINGIPGRRVNQSAEEPRPFDFEALLSRMTQSAQRTMRGAESIRLVTRRRDGTPVQHLPNEHVVLALAECSPAVRNLLTAKKISREQLVAAMQESAKTKFEAPPFE